MARLIWLILFVFPGVIWGQTIHISTTRDTICAGSSVTFASSITGTLTPHYMWSVNSVIAGTDSPIFTSSAIADKDTIRCKVTNLAGDTVFAVSNNVVITVDTMPNAGIIEGLDIVCQHASILLTDSVAGGIWSAENNNATISSGVVTGVRIIYGFDYLVWSSYDSIFYTVTNSCGSSKASKLIEIHPLPNASFFLGTPASLIYSLCLGADATIDAGAGYTHLLYSTYGHAVPDFFNQNVHGVSAGTEILVAVDDNYCGVDTYRMTLPVYTVPEIFPILLPSNEICVGESITLSDSSKGVLDWYSNKYGKIVGWTGLLTGLTPGLDTITLRSSNQCGATYADTVITILPPGLISVNDSLCIGKAVELSNDYPGGIWGSTNRAIASVDQNGNLLGYVSDTVTLNYSIGNCTVSKKISLHPLPNPIAGNAGVCLNSSVSLSETTKPGTWSSEDENIAAIGSTGKVYGINAGSTTINFTNKYGCISSLEFSVNPLPPIINGISDVCIEHGIYLSNNVNGGKWSNRDSAITLIDSMSGYVTGVGSGQDVITYTLPTGCYTASYIKSEYCYEELDIYPNPVNNILSLQVDTLIYNKIRLIDIVGQEVIHLLIKESFTKIDVHLLPHGIYYLEIEGRNKKYLRKIVKE